LTIVTRPSPQGSLDGSVPSPGSYERVDIETIEEATGEPIAELSNESDDDTSYAPSLDGDPQEDVVDSVDTTPMTTIDRTGEIHALESVCRVLMGTKTPEGLALFCGCPALMCTRRTHQAKQLDPSKRALVGVYEGVCNASKQIIDGIVDSYISEEARILKSQENVEAMAQAMNTSSQKQHTKGEYRPKTPSALSFNLEEQPPSLDTSRRSQMREWRDAFEDPAEVAAAPTALVPKSVLKPTPLLAASFPSPMPPNYIPDSLTSKPSIEATLERLTGAMSQKLELW
jgi:hypothetical protein